MIYQNATNLLGRYGEEVRPVLRLQGVRAGTRAPSANIHQQCCDYLRIWGHPSSSKGVHAHCGADDFRPDNSAGQFTTTVIGLGGSGISSDMRNRRPSALTPY